MIKNNTIFITLLLAATIMVGCKSAKTVQKGGASGEIPHPDIVAMQAVTGTLPGYSAKTKFTLNTTDRQFALQGTLRLKENRGVQMSIAPLGLFEVARVEFASLYVLIINRLEKEYSQLHYGNIQLLKQLGLDYKILESILQNRIYLPSGTEAEKALAAMDITLDGDTLSLKTKADGIAYEYRILKNSGLLVKSIGTYGDGTAVTCVYGDFRPVGERMFPHKIALALSGTASPVALSFVLSNVKETLEYSPVAPSPSYKKVSIAGLLDALGGK